MGLENHSSAIYLSVSNGKICRQLQSKSETSIERTNKNGKIVHEEFYDKLSGHLIDVKVREVDLAGQQLKFWEIVLMDEGTKYNLQFNYSSGYANGFLKTIPNADLSQRITIIPKCEEKDGKKKTTIFINQNGNSLKHFYTKENPNGLPQMQKIKFKGKETWDDTDMMQFLEKMINETILPKLNKEVKELEPVVVDADADDDKIPF